MSKKPTKESVNVLQKCIDLQLAKSRDYQNPNSTVLQADYYPNGVSTLLDINHAKMLRMQSVVAAMMSDPDYEPNFESLEDSCIDMINYASCAGSQMLCKMDGQQSGRDMFNKPTSSTNGSFSGVRGRAIK